MLSTGEMRVQGEGTRGLTLSGRMGRSRLPSQVHVQDMPLLSGIQDKPITLFK